MPAIVPFQLRRGTAAQWTASNPILRSGEQGYETDTRYTKTGDGATAWNALPYTLVKGMVRAALQSGGGYALTIDNVGGVFGLSEATPYVAMTASGIAFAGACELAGWDCTAVTGSPTITIYDNTSAAGTVIVPATTLVLGRTEFAYKRALSVGCYVVLSGAQTVNVLVG